MPNYGEVALLASEKKLSATSDPRTQWNLAAQRVFPDKLPSQKKGCPKSAFLGLCEEGLVNGFERGIYTTSKLNKSYALRAVELLSANGVAESPQALWLLVMNGTQKAHNGQMDVVYSLWQAGLLGA
jgi:hypothetical protein